MAIHKTPKTQKRNQRHMDDSNDDLPVDAEIVSEDIEAGYDIQSDAAVRALVSDPASSSEDERR